MKTFLTLFIFLPSLVLASSFSEIKKALKQDGFGEIIPEELHPLISPNAKNPISVSGNSIIGDKSIKFEVNNGECGEEPKSSDGRRGWVTEAEWSSGRTKSSDGRRVWVTEAE